MRGFIFLVQTGEGGTVMGLNFDEVVEAGAYSEPYEIVTVGQELSL